MSWNWSKRGVAISLATAALVVAAILGSNISSIARGMATMKKTPHAISHVVAYPIDLTSGTPVPPSSFMVNIEHPLYDRDSWVSHAKITDRDGGLVGYLLPKMSAPAPVSDTNTKGQKAKNNRITVVFDTTRYYPSPPTTAAVIAGPTTTPTPGSGSILCIYTNNVSDTCPSDPYQIVIDTVNIGY